MAAVLDALASYIQSMLMEMVNEKVHMLLGVSGEIEKLDVNLGYLKNFLADADRRNITDSTVQAWVRKLRGAMYDATDILDLCQLKAMEEGPRGEAGCLNPLLFCMRNPFHAHNIGSRIKKLNQRLDDIKAGSASFESIDLNHYEDRGRNEVSSSPCTVETTGGLDESGLVGEKIEEHTRNIVEELTNGEQAHSSEYNEIMISAIVGVGGIGKTTLAKKIFNNDIIQQQFTKKIWLSVNKSYNGTEILKRAIAEAGEEYLKAGNSKATLEQTLIEALNGHKTLLVMDDVWDYRAWQDVLKTPLVKATLDHGSRVLITTRHNDVARAMFAKNPYHNVVKLETEEAWSLLKKQVVQNSNDADQVEMLKDIGMKIIEKCDCLPLAVKVMGGLLRQKNITQRDWEYVLHNSMWSSVSQNHTDLNSAMYLSYEDLHPCLKSCFLHYSLLPKSKLLYINDIVGMWISEGFIHGSLDNFEEIGKEYYNELVMRNLIEPNARYNDKVVCNMHDVVRSFGQHMARDEAIITRSSEIKIPGNKSQSDMFIRLSLENEGSESDEFDWSSLQKLKSLRTLIFAGHTKIKHGNSLLSCSRLRTLHVDDADIDELAESLEQFKHLRYLSIRGTNISRLPDNIVNMKFLQCINISDCKSLVKLPDGIGTLHKLRFLGLNGTSINSMPRGFRGLTMLRKLYGFRAHMDQDWCSLEELGHLSKLIDLEINGLENVSSSRYATKSRLAEKDHLSYLCLKGTNGHGDNAQSVKEEDIPEKQRRHIEVFDELFPPSRLENLTIEGYFGQRLPRWMTPIAVLPLRSLRILTMVDLPFCTELPIGSCQLPSLELLHIVRAPAINRVGLEFLRPNHHCEVQGSFPRLRRLHFNKLIRWEEWEWEEQVKAMSFLEELTLEWCQLRCLPPGLAFHARALKKLCIYDVKHLSTLENFTSVVHLNVFRNTDLERIRNLPKLRNLVIIECPNMKVLEGMPELKILNLEDHDMETIPGYVQNIKPMSLVLDCSLLLLTSIAAQNSSLEWSKLRHIQQVKAYANDGGVQRKWYVLYTRDPFRFETNINSSDNTKKVPCLLSSDSRIASSSAL
ncbi:unnamed protein product [Urochloa decumbens]|uniref:Uncharacterized protein n=1 Tax=Urochloa decumbens TaxID=240449 RepID=A0ABC9AV08_9POAL